jgi:type III secretion protein J
MKRMYPYDLLLFMTLMFISGCSRRLESGLSQDDAQQIAVLLIQHEINAFIELDPSGNKDAATWMVRIRGQGDTVIKAWQILHENGLPREKVNELEF